MRDHQNDNFGHGIFSMIIGWYEISQMNAANYIIFCNFSSQRKKASIRDSIILCKYYCHICAIKLTHSLRTASLHCHVWILYGLLFFAGKWSASVSSKYYESRRSLHIHTRHGSVIVWEFHFSLFFSSRSAQQAQAMCEI